MADQLFSSSSNPSKTHWEVQGTALQAVHDGELIPHVVVCAQAHEQAASGASAARLACGTFVRCSNQSWRLGQADGYGWVFVPAEALKLASSSSPMSPAVDARYRVALELLQTEESYGRALRLVKDVRIADIARGTRRLHTTCKALLDSDGGSRGF